MQPLSTDAEIVADLLETEGVSDDDDDDDNDDDDDDDDDYSGEVADEPVKCPDKNKLLQVIETLQRFSLFLDNGDTIQSYASRIESQVNQHFAKKKKQASIKDVLLYFAKIPILPQFRLIRIFNSNKIVCPLRVQISGCVLYPENLEFQSSIKVCYLAHFFIGSKEIQKMFTLRLI